VKNNIESSFSNFPSRRFGRTEINIPVLSLGGMRFQQSWEDINSHDIAKENQENLENIIKRGFSLGLNHIETARHYGSSERQLGTALRTLNDENKIIQTKIPPYENVDEFSKQLATSFERLQCEKIDFLAIHGINSREHLDQTIRQNGCLDVVKKYQEAGRIGSLGFSTHGSSGLIVDAINSDVFDFVNLHWYFIKQENDVALDAAKKRDLGVFIISPTDKGGHLHSPSDLLLDLCSPIHPIIFNDLFCLRDNRVHTISVGLSRISDLDLHLEAVNLIDRADEFIPLIQKKLLSKAKLSLGENWINTCYKGLPSWDKTPGHMNLPILLWLHNLLIAWDMESFAKDRYGILGKAGHWFPGENADQLDKGINEVTLKDSLRNSPWTDEIPEKLRDLRSKVGYNSTNRLWN
tara:strand:+ start:2405 stop:3628 length:1224 start_codon:yes stop_codon:yes gene_type:complete